MSKHPSISVLILVLLCGSISLTAQPLIPVQKFITRPVQTPAGIVFSDNQRSALYLYQDDQLTELVSAPGCGYYFSLSPDRQTLGFKLIRPDGRQVPALIDLASTEITELHTPVAQAGQVSFTRDGRHGYTLGNTLHISDGRTFDLVSYANLAPLSPDGQWVTFNDDQDQLWLLELNSGRRQQITDPAGSYYYPQWSPNGHYLLYQRMDGQLRVYDLNATQTYILGKGHAPAWSEDSQSIVYYKKEIAGPQLKNTDLYLSRFDGSLVRQLTDTPDRFEMDPGFTADDRQLLCHTYDRQELLVFSYDQKRQRLDTPLIMLDIKKKTFELNYFPKSKDIQTTQSMDVPYLHQVYDVPNWFWGYYACGPTTAAMLLSYYDILPKWETDCASPSQHVSYWGRYICEKYRYNEVYYQWGSSPAGHATGYGGYGYMWGLGSPNSKMADYYENHGLNCDQDWNAQGYWSKVTADINDGYPYTLCVWLTGSGHLILAKGIVSGQHTVICNDPYGDRNTYGYPSYDGDGALYDWPGYNHGNTNLAYAGSGVPWTVSAHYTPLAPADTLVDDLHVNKGFYLHAEEPASMIYYRDKKAGYHNHYWYIYTTTSTVGDTCYAKWTPAIPDYGNYEVQAYIPVLDNATHQARYVVTHAEGRDTAIIDQAAQAGDWVSLGMYVFAPGNSGSVKLGDATGISGERIAFDALRWKERGTLVIDFTTADTLGLAPHTARFTEQVQYQPEDCQFRWDFGDGQVSNAQNPIHVYKDPGCYTVSLTVDYGLNQYTETKPNYIQVDSAAAGDFALLNPPDRELLITRTPFFYWQSADTSQRLTQTQFATLSAHTQNEQITIQPPLSGAGKDLDHYQLFIHTNSDFQDIMPLETQTNYLRIPEPLADDREYYWMVQAVSATQDTNRSAVWSFKINTANTPPAPFTLLAPDSGEVVKTLQPAFAWQTAEDHDIDEQVTYQLKLGTSPGNFSTLYNGPNTSYTPDQDLPDNALLYWQVIATDLAGAVTENTAGWIPFYTNPQNEPPRAVQLVTPEEHSVTNTLQPVFRWTAATDPDPLDQVSYELNYWISDNPGRILSQKADTTQTSTYPLIDNQIFRWTVLSKDLHDATTTTDTMTFGVDLDPEPPQNFSTLYPADGAQGVPAEVTFTWEVASDPDPFADITYQLKYSPDFADPNAATYTQETRDTTLTLSLAHNTHYEWYVIAKDEDGQTCQANQGTFYSFQTGNTAVAETHPIPREFALWQNYPNPFNPDTRIRYAVPQRAQVRLTIYNVAGQCIATPVNQVQTPGYYAFHWQPAQSGSGIYFYQLQARPLAPDAPPFSAFRKCILLK